MARDHQKSYQIDDVFPENQDMQIAVRLFVNKLAGTFGEDSADVGIAEATYQALNRLETLQE